MTTTAPSKLHAGIGASVVRPDAVPKLTGNFAYASDLWADHMLWAATLHAPFAAARIVRIDTTPALAMAGVHAVLTQEDVPGKPTFGQIDQDQPVFASGEVRYWGEPVAVVAADDIETARRAVDAVDVEYEPLPAVADLEAAEAADSVFRRFRIRRGDAEATGAVVVEGVYETPFVDQAPLGTEAGIAIPDGEGGVDLYVTSQWVHVDHEQIIECLGLPGDQVRCHPTGIGGAFGAREDISLHIHLCLLALRTGRPVKMVYDRGESFVGHVKRHKSKMWFRHEADEDGRLVKVTARVLLDGGAYTHTSPAVLTNAAYFTVGPYRCDNVVVDAAAVRTNNPPAGAMRGFGSVQACFGHESQMDRLADALGLHPLELRRRNALGPGDPMPASGQIIEGSLPTVRVIDALEAIPLPDDAGSDDPRLLPGGTGLTTPAAAVVRGVGYAVGLKNLCFSEAFDDYSEAQIVLNDAGVEVYTAAIEVGQGMVTVLGQIAREVLGIESVMVLPADTSQIGSAGSTSASRQTQMSGGAVHQAATELRDLLLTRFDGDRLDGAGVWRGGELVASLADICAAGPVERHVRFRHPPTEAPDEDGQGSPHAGFAVAAHRAVVDVDPELGLVRVVRVDTAQDVGVALNPQSVIGQIEGGIMQGVGLAVMEELIVDENGVIRNGTFTDYLLPTFLDAPGVEATLIEEPNNWGPFGAKGVGEPPTISSTPAVVAAIRAATGKPLTRVPVRPEDIVGESAAG
jgi:xanthine dehydrogenase D subunit